MNFTPPLIVLGLATAFFLIIYLTVSNHLKRMSLPGKESEASLRAIKIYRNGSLLLLALVALFLILTFI